MSIESANILYFADDLSEVRVAEGKQGYSVFPMKSVAFPRRDLNLVNEMGEVNDERGGEVPNIDRQGVYILLGPSKQEPGMICAYIGQAESVYKRLSQHRYDSSRDWWTDTVVFVVVENGNLNMAHIKQIESCLIRSAKSAGQCFISQKSEPSIDAGKLSQRDQRSMSDLAIDLEVITNALGWNLFKKAHSDFETNVVSTTSGILSEQAKQRFHLKGKGFRATMRTSGSGMDTKYIVEKDSKARSEDMPKLARGIIREREKLKNEKVLRESSGHLEFKIDCSFDFISRAASVVSGQNRNGNTSWRTSDGRTYEEWLKQQPNDEDKNNAPDATKPSVSSHFSSQKTGWKSPPFTYGDSTKEYEAEMQVKQVNEAGKIVDKFVVKEGSRACTHVTPSTRLPLRNRIKNLRNIGVLDDSYRFTQDQEFDSPSTSASVVRGQHINGKKAWRRPGGRTYEQWESEQKSNSEEDDNSSS